ncbi:hypothetical protein HCN44_007108 [Aphidius gifuensis]|uniref:Uncharacterized protein n=1 Tax=Aphidius gifuensis TaxID=684658 RepID=A0A834XKC1_APHGI|nr:hypothetical protein HCN44_007108 [Aphidius gifuensis]
MAIQLDSIKEEVLDKDEKNGEILRDTQSTIVEHLKQQNQQQQQQQKSEIIEIKSAIIIDHQMNNYEPKKIAEQGLSCSPNFDYPGYPGFFEAIRQAKRKKKSHDVSFEILFSYLPESVIKQHDLNLNEWWNYCLFENKDPLETDLSVFIGYLEKKFDVGALSDDLKSISSTICLIASDKMERQIYSSSFLFSEFAKYSAVNNTDCYKTPKSSCQNDSITLSLDSNTKKQDDILPEVIDISDDELDTESPTKLLKKSKDLLNNNEPTNLKKNSVFLQKTINSSQLTTPLKKPKSTKPPAIFLRKRRRNKEENIIKGPITGTINDQNKNETSGNLQSGILLVDTVQKEQQQQPPANNNHAVDSSTKTLTPAIKPDTPVKTPVHHSPSPLIPCQLNTNVLECSSEKLKQNKAETTDNLQSKLLLGNTVKKKQKQHQLPSVNNDKAIDFPRKTLTPAIKPATPVHHITPPLIPCQSNTSALECLSQELKKTKTETTENLQSELLLGDKVEKQQQLPLKNNNQAIDLPSNDVAISITSSVSTSLPLKLQTSLRKTLTPAIKHQLPSANNDTTNIIATNCVLLSTCYFNSSVSTPVRFKLQKLLPAIKPLTPSENLPIHHNTSPLVPCQLNAPVLECLSERLKQNKVKRVVDLPSKLLLSNTVQKSLQQSSANKKQAINIYSNNVVPKTLRVASPSVPSKLKAPVKKTGNLPLLPPCQSNTSVFESSSEVLKQNNVKTTGNLQSYAAPNSISADKNNTTNSDNNSEDSIKNKNNNNKRKHLEVLVEKENSHEIMQNDEHKKLVLSSNDKPTKKKQSYYNFYNFKLSLLCRAIRIGSYKYVSDNNNVVINRSGFILTIETLQNEKSIVKFKIHYDDIIKAKFYFTKHPKLNVLYLHTNKAVGLGIRKLLGIQFMTEPIYDPKSNDPSPNVITLVVDILSHEVKDSLTDQLKMGIRKVVKLGIAHDMLVKTSDGLQL